MVLIRVPALLLPRLQSRVQPHGLIRHHGLLLLLLLQDALPQQLLLLIRLGRGLREPVLAARILEARVLRHLIPWGQVLPVQPGPVQLRLPTCTGENVLTCCAAQQFRLC